MMKTMRAVDSGTMSPGRSRKLARVIALAAVMVGIAATPSQAASITHNFSETSLVHDYDFGAFEYEGETFYLYTFRVGFEAVSTPFNLTITDNLITFEGPDVSSVLGAGFKCAMIAPGYPSGRCVDFIASSSDPGGLPMQGSEFQGDVTVAVRYTPFGWPYFGPDPIDIGVTDNFSSFMLYASRDPDTLLDADYTFRLVHFSSNASDPNALIDVLDPIAHCESSDINACARANGLNNFVVPEPAAVGLVALGFGLTALRRLRRRD